MEYPEIPDFNKLTESLTVYAQLKQEYGSPGVQKILAEAEKSLQESLIRLKNLPVDSELKKQNPDNLEEIRALRPKGSGQPNRALNKSELKERLLGSLLGRFAGCTLGAPVEFWPIRKMENMARELGTAFPPEKYWSHVPDPFELRYQRSARELYTGDKLNGVPVDDDITYTILGLLIAEQYGPGFSTDDVGKAWIRYLPMACTAEEAALENLKKGIPAERAGETDNPYCEWIGADIRSDPWAYLAPGNPELAAEYAFRDAFLSHRRQGIYGSMFFAAAISAAFMVDDPLEALKIGLTQIPEHSDLAKALRWALDIAPRINNYREARNAVENKFKGMHPVHTINNACLTVWGITIGRKDFTRVIGETVAMGMDNDCTAATAGSIVGAVIGKTAIPDHWYAGFHDKVYTYLTGHEVFSITDVAERFIELAL